MEKVNQAFHTKTLRFSQREAVIKLTEKKDQDKWYVKNWKPISLLNVGKKILSAAVSNNFETVFLTLIPSQQTAYVTIRFIGESGTLISDIIEISS